MQNTAMVWFRSDLRVADNPALYHAAKSGLPVIGIFAPCIKQWQKHDWGANKINYVLRQVAALNEQLAKLNIPLLKLDATDFVSIPGAMIKLVKKHHAKAVYFNDELEVNEEQRDEKVQVQLEVLDVDVHRSHGQTVIPPHLIKTLADVYYKVYTPYRKAWESELDKGDYLQVLPKPRKQKPLDIASANWQALIQKHPTSQKVIDLWPAGEEVAHKQLKAYCNGGLLAYNDQRDFPSIEGTSRLSAAMACGVVSAKQCYAKGLAAISEATPGQQSQIRVWLSELIWREFYRHVLIGFPRVCRNHPFKTVTRNIPWSDNEQHFRGWCDGRTGFPIVGAAMRQLNETGWMHNRLRMITAMFLTKDLLIDWRWGERYFMNQLVDGDFASNNGGWQWAASTGTDAVPYFRIFNPTSQSQRFDPQGQFIRAYLPQLADIEGKAIHDPPPLIRGSCDYPMPMIDHAKARQRTLAIFKNL
ncbi:MAG TPA: deoxyribodipyrimidine photo-lyase [Phycisphaerales bacterium]|nr:deoxyribodipyrimidine photo-lyase [Phycisphaerales bacterium]